MEQKQIKGTKKTQKNKNEKIIKCNKYINLGVNSTFDVGDIAYILTDKEYNELKDNATANATAIDDISKLNEIIKEKETEIAKLTESNNELKVSNAGLTNSISEKESIISELNTDITGLNNTIQQKDKELSKYNNIDIDTLQQKAETLETENKQHLEDINERDKYIIYLEQLQTDYKELINYLRNKNFLTPLLNLFGATDVVKPQLKHLDMKGHQLTSSNEPILTQKKETDSDSE